VKNAADRAFALARLRDDVLTNIVTLKMLRLYGGAMQLESDEDDTGWALLSLLPVPVSEFDRQTYPEADYVVLVDGNSPAGKARLLERLPPGRLIIKTSDGTVKAFAAKIGAKKVRSFKSFSRPAGSPPLAPVRGVTESETLRPEIAHLLFRNGYQSAELAGYFADGARWFAVEESARPVSVGFVYRNFETVWEIAGLFTEPPSRRRGLARHVVLAAIAHLAGQSLITRYQVRSDNFASIQLAQSVGLQEFLEIDHFVAEPTRR
jgi:ribosomal protein S18 acetylase RimI-like enzyme